MIAWIILYFVVTLILTFCLVYLSYKIKNVDVMVFDIARNWFILSLPIINIGILIWLIFDHFKVFEIVVFKRKE